MEKFLYYGFLVKNLILGGGVHMKKVYSGNCLKEGAWQKGGEGVFEGGLTPQCILWILSLR